MSTSASNAPAPRNLPKKESELFRSVVKFYEIKQYKKGIKAADTILSKLPNHGETQSMRALLLHMLGQKDEAYSYIKLGLRNDIKSHVCWHAYGLMHRSDQNYKEAVKSFLNALRIEPENQPILRDLSWLQAQIRDLDGFVETRRKLLRLKPNIRQTWVTYAVANFAAHYYDTGFEVVQKYNETVSDKEDEYAESELLLFQNMCLEKQGLFERSIAHLESHKDAIVDKLALRVKMAELLAKQGKFPEAKYRWSQLVSEQPDNYRFLCGLQTAHLQLDPETAEEMFNLKRLELPSTTIDLKPEEMASLLELHKNPKFKSRAAQKIILSLAQQGEFKIELDKFLRKHLRDGFPSLYADICALIRKPDAFKPSRKVCVVDPLEFRTHPITVITLEMINEYIRNLRTNGTFDQSPDEYAEVEVPTALLWSLFLRTHLLELSGLLSEALIAIDEAIEHTPTALDMQQKKARVLKKAGDFAAAAEVMERCRVLDLQDRYLNNKSTKYLMRADKVGKAMDTIAMFTKHDGDPQYSLYELQCNWYELELAESFLRQKSWGMALKKFYAIEHHFLAYYEDQFDFHGYCVRKTTLRAYMDMLKMEDTVFAHKFYQRAARGVISIFLKLLDNPSLTSEKDAEDVDMSSLSPEERKKEKNRLRKLKKKEVEAEEAKKRAADEEAAREKKSGSEKNANKPFVMPKDEDPNGEKLLEKCNLEECARWSMQIQKLEGCEVETHVLIADVMIRRNKFSRALRSIVVGLRQVPRHAGLTYMLCKIAKKFLDIESDVSTVPSMVSQIIRARLATFLGASLDVNTFVETFVTESTSLSVLHRVAAARCLLLLRSPTANDSPSDNALVTRAVALLTDHGLWEGKGVLVKTVSEAYKFILHEAGREAEADAFKAQCLERFPYINQFGAGLTLPSNEDETSTSFVGVEGGGSGGSDNSA